MTGYQIGPVTYRNFMPFEEASFDFSKPGLTLVEGRIEGRRGCDSNGAGKSAIFDGVAWALYDRCIREKYKGDDVVRLGSKGGACVRVNIVGGPKPIVVERYRNHSKWKNKMRLLIDGEDRTKGTNDLTREAVETLVGMDFRSFCNSVAFGVRDDVKSFFAAPESERKAVMDRIFGLLIYERAEKEARKRLSAVEEGIQALDIKRGSLLTKIEERKSTLADAKAAVSTIDEMQTKELRVRIGGINKKLAKEEKHHEDLLREQAEEQELFDAEMARYKEADKAYLLEKQRLEQADRRLQREIAEWKGKLKSAERMQAKFAEMKGKQCPTCFQKVSDRAVQQVHAGTEGEIAEASEAIRALQEKSDGLSGQLEGLIAPEEPESPELDTLQGEIDLSGDELRELKHQRDVAKTRLESLQKEQDRLEDQVTAAQAKVEQAAKEIVEVEKQYQLKCFERDQTAFWVEGFGNGGLKSFLLEAEIPEINRRATAYARRLLGEGALVKLSATKVLKSKAAVREQLSIEATIPGCTETYAGASKGQKKRLDLSLLLAFRDIVSERNVKPIQQLFADEIFDGLDKTGNESVALLLLEVAEECPVALVTHISGLKSIAHSTVIVYHTGEKATLLQHGAEPKKAPGKKPLKKKRVKKQ